MIHTRCPSQEIIKSRKKKTDIHLFVLLHLLQPSSDVYVKILAGDEVIQVNNQIVVSETGQPGCARWASAVAEKCFSVWNIHHQALCGLRWAGAERTW